MKTISLASVILLIVLNIAGCYHREQGQMQETVRQYCLLLAEGYQNLDMHRLNFVATKEQTAKVYNHMAALGEGRLKMVSKLLSLDFLTVQEESDGHTTMQTREKWKYSYLNIDSGKPEISDKVTYTLLYHLEKANDHWLVAAIDIEKSTQDHEQHIPRFFKRPADCVQLNSYP